MSILIGLDPGARNTGIIAIQDDGHIMAVTVTNSGALLPVPADYLADVIGETLRLLTHDPLNPTIRVESITRPNWHVGKGQGGGSASNPEALLGTAQVLGAVMAHFDCELIPPGRNGSKPLGAYPTDLVSDAERRKEGWEQRVGGGKLRHVRSAWDVANYSPLATRPLRTLNFKKVAK